MSSIENLDFTKKLKDCQAILRYLSSYPEVLQQMDIKELLKPEELEQQYLEWKKNVAKYSGLEKNHFKYYWLPIETDNFQFFIDLSSSDYTIIESVYINEGKDSEEYISSNLFFTASEFLLMTDHPEELERHFERHLMHRYFTSPDRGEVVDMDDFDFFNSI